MGEIRTIEQLTCRMMVMKYSFYREKISLLKKSISIVPAIIYVYKSGKLISIHDGAFIIFVSLKVNRETVLTN